MKECPAFFDFASGIDQGVYLVQLVFAQAHGHAQFAQIAARAGYFDALRVDRNHLAAQCLAGACGRGATGGRIAGVKHS